MVFVAIQQNSRWPWTCRFKRWPGPGTELSIKYAVKHYVVRAVVPSIFSAFVFKMRFKASSFAEHDVYVFTLCDFLAARISECHQKHPFPRRNIAYPTQHLQVLFLPRLQIQCLHLLLDVQRGPYTEVALCPVAWPFTTKPARPYFRSALCIREPLRHTSLGT